MDCTEYLATEEMTRVTIRKISNMILFSNLSLPLRICSDVIFW